MSYNRIIMWGNLTRDPEVKEIGSTQLCKFTLGVNRKYKNRAGELQEEVCFLDIEAWGSLADACGKYLEKGHSVLVEGYLKQERWDTPDGSKRSKHILRADNVSFMGNNSVKKNDNVMQNPEGQVELPF